MPNLSFVRVSLILAALLTGAVASAQQTPASTPGGGATPTPATSPAALKLPPAPDDVAAAPADGEKTASGLVTKVLQPGTGTGRPGPNDYVRINYTGWTSQGRAFDSTVARGRPSNLLLDRVMKGMSEGIQLMVVGEKRRLWVPEPLAFAGAAGRPTGPLVFDIELVAFEPPPTQAPPDVAKPPSDAKRTGSGLSYKVLRPGTGTEHPKSTSKVSVHYTGWTTDGKMFDSSVVRGQPATFPLDMVIKGWTEGVQLMVPGEKTRFWIPERLAYEGKEGKPAGMLVFDVELISIEK